MRYSSFKRLLKSRTHVDLHQTEPVPTLANDQRVLRDRPYAEAVADRLLEILFDIDNYRGTGRLYVP